MEFHKFLYPFRWFADVVVGVVVVVVDVLQKFQFAGPTSLWNYKGKRFHFGS